MSCASAFWRHLFESIRFQIIKGGFQIVVVCLKNWNSSSLKLANGSSADATHHGGLNVFGGESGQWIARAVLMVRVRIFNNFNCSGSGLDNGKKWCRAEMIANNVIKCV
jgi:hypothetical protein